MPKHIRKALGCLISIVGLYLGCSAYYGTFDTVQWNPFGKVLFSGVGIILWMSGVVAYFKLDEEDD